MLTFLTDLTPEGAVCLAVSVFAAWAAPCFLLVGASRTDFDPRPALARVVESGRFDLLLAVVANARYTPRHAAPRRSPLALRLNSIPSAPQKGALR